MFVFAPRGLRRGAGCIALAVAGATTNKHVGLGLLLAIGTDGRTPTNKRCSGVHRTQDKKIQRKMHARSSQSGSPAVEITLSLRTRRSARVADAIVHRSPWVANRRGGAATDVRNKKKLEIWGKAQRESARRPKSDWGKLEGGVKRVERIFPASKSRGPNSNALAYAERASST